MTRLPAPGNATPMTYRGANGKQYVVIAAGGPGHLRRPPGESDTLIARALPRNKKDTTMSLRIIAAITIATCLVQAQSRKPVPACDPMNLGRQF